MRWFSSIFRKKINPHKQKLPAFTLRQGKPIPVDDAFLAWTSGNLDEMLKAVQIKTNLIDRHFLFQSIVTESYKLRKEEKYRDICIEYSERHLQEFPSIVPALKEDMDNCLPTISTFQHYQRSSLKKTNMKRQSQYAKKL